MDDNYDKPIRPYKESGDVGPFSERVVRQMTEVIENLRKDPEYMDKEVIYPSLLSGGDFDGDVRFQLNSDPNLKKYILIKSINGNDEYLIVGRAIAGSGNTNNVKELNVAELTSRNSNGDIRNALSTAFRNVDSWKVNDVKQPTPEKI